MTKMKMWIILLNYVGKNYHIVCALRPTLILLQKEQVYDNWDISVSSEQTPSADKT